MAGFEIITNIAHDPDSVLIERERYAIVTMATLADIMQNSTDSRARVAAAVEMNKMLSIGDNNRSTTTPKSATQVNNIQLGKQPVDPSTARLLERFVSSVPDTDTVTSPVVEKSFEPYTDPVSTPTDEDYAALS
jgi:hypothetical protein